MNGENGNNNQNNNYNIYNSMNDDAFNVFNQNVPAPTPTEVAPTPTAPTEPVPVQPAQIGTSPTPNLVTVNDYKEPKKPFSFKDLLKKKVEEEEKTFSIDDITNFKEEKKPDIDPEEAKEKKKKVKDIIILVVALIALVIVGIIAYNVFSNYLLPSENVIDSNIIRKNIHSSKVVKEKKEGEATIYNCNNTIDNTFYNLPYTEYINWDLYKGNATFSFVNDKLDVMNETYNITYNMLTPEETSIIVNYCNSYNKVLDQYQLLCKYSNNILVITNSYYLNKIDGEITNTLGTFNIKYNKNTILGDLLSNNSSCAIEK